MSEGSTVEAEVIRLRQSIETQMRRAGSSPPKIVALSGFSKAESKTSAGFTLKRTSRS